MISASSFDCGKYWLQWFYFLIDERFDYVYRVVRRRVLVNIRLSWIRLFAKVSVLVIRCYY